MRKFIFIIGLLAFLFALQKSISAQNLKITVKDSQNQPLVGATVKLTKIKDNTVVYVSSNLSGLAFFQKLENTLYHLEISFIGYQTLTKTINLSQNNLSFEYKLKDDALQLDEVTVSAKSSLIRVEDDKLIVDPENLAAISNNVYEVLENTPGLYVDQDGGVFLNSVTPAKVYINGREQKMTNQDISTILQNLPPNSVQKIEILRTPSTKYDAASSGGIINIVLKKGFKIGKFGSVNTGFFQNKFSNSELGFSFNDSGEKISFYLNANYNYRHSFDSTEILRILQSNMTLSQSAETERLSHQFSTSYGINYDISEFHKFSYDGRINYGLQNSESNNLSAYKNVLIDNIVENQNITNISSNFLNLQQDLNYTFKFDTLGSEWDSKFGYNYSRRNSDQQDYYYLLNPRLNIFDGLGNSIQERSFLTFQSDFTFFFKHKFKLETGAKSSLQYFNNQANFTAITLGHEIKDELRTNFYNYFESINAVYLQASKTLPGNFVIKGGSRLEHTYMLGEQTIPSKSRFLVNRVDFFPYVYLSRRVFKMKDFELQAFAIYRRSINRPGYQMLNPSINLSDQYSYETGNPNLKPQFTDNIELNVSFQDFPVFAVGRNYTKDIFSGVIYSDENNTDISVKTYDNLGKNTETYFRGMIGIPPGKRYFFGAGGQYNLNEYDGFYQNQVLNYTRGSWRFFTFHQLKITSTTRLVISGFLMLKGNMDFYELKNFGSLNIGLRQNFFNNRLNISINARDILKTMVVKFDINQNNIISSGSRYANNRQFGFTLKYSFGIEKREKRNFFKNGMDEEF